MAVAIDAAWLARLSARARALAGPVSRVLVATGHGGLAAPEMVDQLSQACVFSVMFHPGLVPRVPGVPIDVLLQDPDVARELPGPGDAPGAAMFEDTYEAFLALHDPATRRRKGAFYTPAAVVSFLVEAVDAILAGTFGFPQGLLDGRARVFDPAAGAGTFLVEVARTLLAKLEGVPRAGDWSGPWLAGNEPMLAPVVNATTVLDRLVDTLRSRGVAMVPPSMQARGTLQPAGLPAMLLEALPTGHVAVVLGNPPYSVRSANKHPFIDGIMSAYKDGLEERNMQPLADDYIKFIRLAQWIIDRHERGILAFITNNSFIYKVIHRVMRASLLASFTSIHVLDLHGNTNIGEQAPGGGKDENVFDIKIGVAIVVMVKDPARATEGVFHHEIHGTREKKLAMLASTPFTALPWVQVIPGPPAWRFVPRDDALEEHYLSFPSLTSIFPVSIVGVKTHRDAFIIAPTTHELQDRLLGLRDAPGDAAGSHGRLLNNTPAYVRSRQALLEAEGIDVSCLLPYLYRPFDVRCIYYHPAFITRDRLAVMRHLLDIEGNVALVTTRLLSGPAYTHVMLTGLVGDIGVLSSRTSESAYFFPLLVLVDGTPRANISDELSGLASREWGVARDDHAAIMHYVLAIFHVPAYGTRYHPFLAEGFPRVPLVAGKNRFEAFRAAGSRLAASYLSIERMLRATIELLPGTASGAPVIQDATHDPVKERVILGPSTFITNVPERAWSFHVGNYPVLRKWLRQRKGRVVSPGIIEDVRAIVDVINAILDERVRLDRLFNETTRAGGWLPGC